MVASTLSIAVNRKPEPFGSGFPGAMLAVPNSSGCSAAIHRTVNRLRCSSQAAGCRHELFLIEGDGDHRERQRGVGATIGGIRTALERWNRGRIGGQEVA